MKIGIVVKVMVSSVWLMYIAIGHVFAQMQPDIPQPRGPVDLSETSNLVLFIILPVLVFIGFLFWRRAMKKRAEKGEQ